MKTTRKHNNPFVLCCVDGKLVVCELWQIRDYSAPRPVDLSGWRFAWPREYRLVGFVDCLAPDEVFANTQDDWELDRAYPIVADYRSTSVGDVVITPDCRVYRCERVGWSLIEVVDHIRD